MRKSLVGVIVLVLLLAGIPSVLADSWHNEDDWTATLDLAGADGTLVITPGASGEWVDGGYSFNKTAYATRTDFKPLHNQGAMTIDLWVECNYATGVQYVFSQYVSTNVNVKIIFSGTNVYFDIGTGSTNANARAEGILVNGSVYHIVGTWNKSVNSGKPEIFDNGSRHIASAGMTSNSSADDKLYFSGADGSTSLAKVTVLSCAIYYFMFDYSHVNATGHAPDTFFENASYYWTFNEASGLSLFAGGPAWFPSDQWSESAPDVLSPYTPGWRGQDGWSVVPSAPVPSTDFSLYIPPWLGLLGMILIPGGLSYPFIKKRLNGDIEFNDIGTAILMFFLGFAFLIGSVM